METEILSVLVSGFRSFARSSFFHYLKIISGFATSVLLVADILLLSKRIQGDIHLTIYGSKMPKIKKSKYLKKWEQIKRNILTGKTSNAKVAIIEADQMLGEILERIGYPGKTVGEKIQAVKPGQLIGLEEVTRSHDLAKMIVKNPKFEAEIETFQSALSGYEKVFRGLELFD